MITAEAALAAATAYLANNRRGVTVVGLYEDNADYLADLHYEGPTPVGGSWIFVSKVTGEVREVAPVEVLDQAYAMTKVRLP